MDEHDPFIDDKHDDLPRKYPIQSPRNHHRDKPSHWISLAASAHAPAEDFKQRARSLVDGGLARTKCGKMVI